MNSYQQDSFDRSDRMPFPSWFVRPVAIPPQGSLFGEDNADQVLAELHISRDETQAWQKRGWLGFDPDKARRLEPEHIEALVYIRNASRSGIPSAVLDQMLKVLPEGYLPDATRLAYSFVFGWVECAPPQDPHEVVDENLDYWLEGLAEDGEFDRLKDVAGRIDDLLKKYEVDCDEDEAGE